MANPLIPQKRPDKNNRLVTRHVRANSGQASPVVVPAPALAKQFRVHPQDVRKPRRAGISKSAVADARFIRKALSIPDDEVTSGSVDISDNEMFAFMKQGFLIAQAVEFKRYGATVDDARYVGVPRNIGSVKCVERMQSLNMSPEDAARVLRHGVSDRMLDRHLSDEELFGLLYKENLNSTKYRKRSMAARFLIDGTATPEDAAELGIEALGDYGGTLRDRRRAGLSIDYETIRSAIVRHEAPYQTLPETRRREGWSFLDHKPMFHNLLTMTDKHGPEILEFKYLAVVRMNRRFGETLDDYKYMDEFFSRAQSDEFSLNDEQRLEMFERDPKTGRTVADYVEMLRQDGLTPEQVVHSLRNDLTLEKAHQVHLNKLAPAMIEGWL